MPPITKVCHFKKKYVCPPPQSVIALCVPPPPQSVIASYGPAPWSQVNSSLKETHIFITRSFECKRYIVHISDAEPESFVRGDLVPVFLNQAIIQISGSSSAILAKRHFMFISARIPIIQQRLIIRQYNSDLTWETRLKSHTTLSTFLTYMYILIQFVWNWPICNLSGCRS